MATITRFEELEIWQLAFAQTQDFDILAETTALGIQITTLPMPE